jgi:DNA-binding MarR family transcriptional regulator
MADAELHDIAADLLKIVPLMMRLVAANMRQTAHSVHPAHFQLLAMLSKRPRRLSDLAEKQAVSVPTMSNTVTTLEERGWVVRERAADDRRVVEVNITPEGRAIREEVEEEMIDRVARMLAGLPADRREVVRGGLGALREWFETALPLGCPGCEKDPSHIEVETGEGV